MTGQKSKQKSLEAPWKEIVKVLGERTLLGSLSCTPAPNDSIVGLQVLPKEIELKASGQVENHQALITAPPISLSCPAPNLGRPRLLLPTPPGKGMWPIPHPAPKPQPPTNRQVYPKTPLPHQSAGQQVYRRKASPRSLGYTNRHSSSSGRHPSLISVNLPFSFTSLGWKSFF